MIRNCFGSKLRDEMLIFVKLLYICPNFYIKNIKHDQRSKATLIRCPSVKSLVNYTQIPAA